MNTKNISRTIIAVIAVSFAAQFVFKYFKKRKGRVRKEINEVIMFSYGATELQKSKYSRCVITHSMDRLLYYMNAPRHSIDICMYVITNADICNVLLKLNYKGVKIRIIIDADMAYTGRGSVRKLETRGIPVRWMKSPYLMHHKFCLIDTQTSDEQVIPFVILGSLNWTNQALNGNWENVAVTSQKDLVQQYKEEFERLWVLFKPIVM